MVERIGNRIICTRGADDEYEDRKHARVPDYVCNMIDLLQELDGVDTYQIGDEHTYGNFASGFTLYCLNNGLVFELGFGDAQEWFEGKRITLYGHEPDEDELEMIKEWMGEE